MSENFFEQDRNYLVDFADVKGQAEVKEQQCGSRITQSYNDRTTGFGKTMLAKDFRQFFLHLHWMKLLKQQRFIQ